MVFYAGTHLSEAAERDDGGLRFVLSRAIQHSGVAPECEVLDDGCHLHADVLWRNGTPVFAVLMNPGGCATRVRLPRAGTWRGVFGSDVLVTDEQGAAVIPDGMMELLYRPES